ncbi:ketoisovalerate oxidoreductase subunit VorA [Striga asiatica]|uniref:Ketoisovalerate oxidoreductase subunit VorA n=1 Tax=Striga asiatica TaxID=4170 RepID=A0A5A7PTJ2_STRAF|nr:ketoisovalerate oxidoreductase subunit VorA [Striga asiatica]
MYIPFHNLHVITTTTTPQTLIPNPPQPRQHLPHRRPHLPLLLQAPKRQLSHQRHNPPHPTIRPKPEPLVHQLIQSPVLNLVHRHARQVNILTVPVGVHCPLIVLRVNVSRSSLWGRGDMCDVGREETGEAEIGHFHVEIRVEEDVVGFHVAVDDVGFVEVVEGLGRLDSDVEADGQRDGSRGTVAVEVVGDCAVGDELVDEEELAAAVGGAAVEGDEVFVAEACQDLDLVHELLHALERGIVLLTIIHGAEATIAEDSRRMEIVGSLFELGVIKHLDAIVRAAPL